MTTRRSAVLKSKQPRKGRASQPRYLEIADKLLKDIESGALAVGNVLEPEQDLSLKFKVSRGTIRQSLALLEEQGVILRRQRSGTKILSRFPGKGLVSGEQLLEDWARYGIEYPLRVSAVSRRELPSDLFKGEDRASGKWLCVVGLRYPIGSRVPISYCESFIHPDYSEIEQDLSPTPIPMFAHVERRYGRVIESVQVQLRAMGLPAVMAKPLGAEAGQPALQLIRLFMDARNRVVTVGINTHPAERYTYNIEIPRQPAVPGTAAQAMAI